MTEAGIGYAIDSIIEQQVLPELLPRLLRRHAPPLLDEPTLRSLADLAADLTRDAVCGSGSDPASHLVDDAVLLAAVLAVLPNGSDRYRDRTVPLPLVCREILTPVARALGERWTSDELSFAAVTVGAGRLHAVLRALSAAAAGGEVRAAAPRILLLPTPHENHRLGLSMAAALFRNAGWIVQTGEPDGPAALGALLDRLPPDLVGFSCSCDRHLPALADSVRAVRRLRPDLPVVAGGPLFDRRPGLERRLRLDAVFTDGAAAPEQAAALLRERRLPGTVRDLSIMLGRLRNREREVVRAGRGGGTRGDGFCAAHHPVPRGVRPRSAGRGGDPQDRAGGG